MSVHDQDAPAPWRRRAFLAAFTRTLGTSALLAAPRPAGAVVPAKAAPSPLRDGPNVREVIDLILKSIPGAPYKETVDTLQIRPSRTAGERHRHHDVCHRGR
jgi:hypothetical protein